MRIPLNKLVNFICFNLAVMLYFSVIENNTKKTQIDHVEKIIFKEFSISSLERSTVSTPSARSKTVKRIVLSFVVCNSSSSRFNMSLNVVKTVLIFTKSPVQLVIFTEYKLMPKFKEVLRRWISLTSRQLDFELHPINYPKKRKMFWMNLFRKCAAQRLFIPALVPHIDSMIYVDTDTLFLGPVDELWSNFFKFNSSQIAGLALEDNYLDMSWYPRRAKHPYYGKLGLNSGVILMNLTRMRAFGWNDYITPIMLKWNRTIVWGDQDIINILFHNHSRAVFELSCRYNYRTDYCEYGDGCADAVQDGILLLHGYRDTFDVPQKEPAFRAIYRAVDEYEVGVDLPETFLANIDKYLTDAPKTQCGTLKDAYLKIPSDTLTHMYRYSSYKMTTVSDN